MTKLNMKVFFIIVILASAFAVMISCSRVSGLFANPGEPAITLRAVLSSQGATNRITLSWPYDSIFLTADDSKSSWNILYAYYVYHSPQNPYDGYTLAARLFNTNATNSFDEIDYDSSAKVSTNTVQFDLDYPSTNGVQNIIFSNMNRYVHKSTNQNNYYRVVRYELKKNTKTKDINGVSYDEVSYNIEIEDTSVSAKIEL